VLAEQQLDSGASRTYSATSPDSAAKAARRARAVADRTRVKRARRQDLATWSKQQGRTTYFFDVRSVAEYEKAHLPGFYPIPGGQLVQETEMYAPVRGARIVLADHDGVRANMSASWLAQMAWEVWVVDGLTAEDFSAVGAWRPELPARPDHSGAGPINRYQRPYVGTRAPREAMQAYLDWEDGLIAQLHRDGTHHFEVCS